VNNPKTFLEPLAGYLADVGAKLRGDLFIPHSLTKLHNLLRAKARTGATTVIEVGSFRGVTTRRLARHFEYVHSIEIDPALFAEAKQRCAGQGNVAMHLGDGKEVLAQLAPSVGNCLLFLDGHFSGGVTGQGDEPEPVLEELDVVRSSLDNFVGVVVDDFHEFGMAQGWPAKSEVMARLERVMPEPAWLHAVMYDQFICVRRNARGRA
jgi:hypothetical protein